MGISKEEYEIDHLKKQVRRLKKEAEEFSKSSMKSNVIIAVLSLVILVNAILYL